MVEISALNDEKSGGGGGDRDERGHFLPGHGVRSPGRPKREVERAILDGLTSALSQEEITQLIKDAVILAKEQKSARGIVAVLALVAGYGIGTPVQRSDTTDSNAMDDAIAKLMSRDMPQ